MQKNNHPELATIIRGLVEAKAAENRYKAMRIAMEEKVALLIATKDEGTDKAQVGNYKVTVTSKLTRSLDYEAYQAVESHIPEGLRCVELKPALDLKKLRAMDMARPGFSAQFVTSKPAKAAVKVEEA